MLGTIHSRDNAPIRATANRYFLLMFIVIVVDVAYIYLNFNACGF